MQFTSKHPGYEHLRKKWVQKHKNVVERVWDKHKDVARHLALSGMSGMMLLTIPNAPLLLTDGQMNQTHVGEHEGAAPTFDKQGDLAKNLREMLPKDEVRKLTDDEDQKIAQTLTAQFGVSVKADIDGKRLNRTYGMIGAEQHLYRYPGDTPEQHAESAEDWAMYGRSGIAPGLGAWGYFTQSKDTMTELDKARERYYIAVPTFLSPGFSENVRMYRDFYKYRKMLVVNPKTGQSVMTDIADAGPAEWTGKHLGGSPEVMHLLGLGGGPRKGAVLYYFVEDPEDRIPLGPIEVK
jgi:hypothetical protein